jgi:SAM-dependent methyltransferase
MTEPRSIEPVAAALARLYDLDLAEDPGDANLLLALAARSGGPILELASGSGRVALPLADAGYEITAVDLDPAMIRRAELALSAVDDEVRGRVTLVEADLLGLELPGGARFGLGLVALNSILLMGTRARQREAFATLARHLRPGGLAVVDTWVPGPDELARYDGSVGLEYVRRDPESGLIVTKTMAAEYEPATGHVTLTAIYDEGEPGGPVRRWIRQDRLLLADGEDLADMAEAAGLVVEVVAGGYDLEPVAPHDDRAVLVARKRGRPAPRD